MSLEGLIVQAGVACPRLEESLLLSQLVNTNSRLDVAQVVFESGDVTS